MTKNMEEKKKSFGWRSYLQILAGTTAMALAVNLAYEPLHLVTGGFSGLAILMKELTKGWIPGGVPLWCTNLVLNAPLFLLAMKKKGRRFLCQTLVATLWYTLMMWLLPQTAIMGADPLLAAVFGGTVSGLGLGLVFWTGGSTGGTDLCGILLQEHWPYLTVPRILFFLDGGIVLAGMAVFGIRNGLYALIGIFIASKLSDTVVEGGKFGKMAFIVTNEKASMADAIFKHLNRGVTALDATGMYSGKNRSLLYCVVSKKEIVALKEVVGKVDPQAFLSISDVREVRGEGFLHLPGQ